MSAIPPEQEKRRSMLRRDIAVWRSALDRDLLDRVKGNPWPLAAWASLYGPLILRELESLSGIPPEQAKK